MPPETDIVYWDSDLFISRIQRTPGRIEVLEEITNPAERGELKLVTSAWTMVEVAKLDKLDMIPEEQEQLIVRFFDNAYIIVRPLDDQVARMARKLIREHALKPADAVHIATALRWKIALVHAYDKHFLRLDGEIPGLSLQEPRWDQPSLGLDVQH